ncbi:MAG: diaminopimelate decarboxylase [Candidatus Diapherotrites archaeon]|nr:diaminopimelate decarboxylase [Candidatus Diapherotrites archaeon]
MTKKNWYESKDHLEIKNNQLFIGGLNTTVLAKQFGTPLYVYNGNRIVENFQRLKTAFIQASLPNIRIHYAMKANFHPAILRLLNQQNAFLDCVSPNEVLLGLKAGFSSEKILFTGTSVSNDDLKILLKAKVLINIDSLSQLKRLKKLVKSNAGKVRISVRWNPGSFGAGLHDHTITAGKHVKFGIPEKQVLNAFKLAKIFGFQVVGLHEHIGSGWKGKDVQTFLKTVSKTLSMAEKAEKVLGYSLEFVDLGGGPGIPYSVSQDFFPIQEYAKGIALAFQNSKLTCSIAIEPGRYVVGDSGILLTTVNTVEQKGSLIAGVDSGFNCLIRPAFYGAFHEIVNCNQVNSKQKQKYMVAGNLCESSDFFNESKYQSRPIPGIQEGTVLALLCAGAYGYAMSSNYNLRARPAEVLIWNKKAKIITRKDSFKEIVKKFR